MSKKSVDDLKEKAEEIMAFVKNQNFKIFYSKELDDYEYDFFNWDLSMNWKDFFSIAKDEGAKIIVSNISTFDSTNNDIISTAKSFMEENEESVEKENMDFTKYNGKVGSYQFVWVKDGSRYSLSETTQWYQELKQLTSLARTAYTQQEKMSLHTSFREAENEIPSILKNKSEDEFANEMVEFIQKESPDASGNELHQFIRLFWNDRGLSNRLFNPEADTIMLRIEMKARKIYGQKQTKEENEKMPKLVEECLSWAKKNGLMKLTQGEIGVFVTENDINLSSEGQRKLWQKVNLELKVR